MCIYQTCSFQPVSASVLAVLTQRLAELTHSKTLHKDYMGDRPSPIWSIKPSVLNAVPSTRICSLSRPKTAHPMYEPPKGVMTMIPPAALRATASAHVHKLSRHKTYPPLHIMEHSEWDWGEWPTTIPQGALHATASGRVEDLSAPKKPHKQYLPPRSVQWEVRRSTRSAVASERVKKLANAKSRNEQYEDYNPKAWQVSVAAQHAQASERLGELAVPLARKCRTKKA